MSTYVIGDIQGCYQQLQNLLSVIEFNPEQDKLWFAGDLVNRGPDNIHTLRFIRQLGDKAITVLGNHDLHLLAVVAGAVPMKKKDTIKDILEAPDRDELCQWLRQQPLIHHDSAHQATLVHAGIAPQWDLETAQRLAHEVESTLSSDKATDFFNHMYGDKPDCWDEQLTGWDRLRTITNYCTRMRFCDSEGAIELNYKGKLGGQEKSLVPWYQHPKRHHIPGDLYFGHWAALEGKCDAPNIYVVDGGCVWGGKLLAMRLEDKKVFCHTSP